MVSSPNLNLDPDLNLNKDVFEYKLILQNADQRSGIRDQDSRITSACIASSPPEAAPTEAPHRLAR